MSEVVHLTEEEYLHLCKKALDDVGLTYEELEEKIRNRSYSLREKLTWIAVKGSCS